MIATRRQAPAMVVAMGSAVAAGRLDVAYYGDVTAGDPRIQALLAALRGETPGATTASADTSIGTAPAGTAGLPQYDIEDLIRQISQPSPPEQLLPGKP